MQTLFWIGGVLVVGYFVVRYMLFVKRYSAAMNVVLAKYTFSTLAETDKCRVEKRAEEIVTGLLRGRFEGYWGECDKFGWFALAMAELGIPPAIEEPKWNYVRNPFFAVQPADKAFGLICEYLKRKHGVEIAISRGHRLFDEI